MLGSQNNNAGARKSRLGLLHTRHKVACSAGLFWTHECTFWYEAAILDLATVADWGEEIFAEGVGVKWKKWARGEGECSTASCVFYDRTAQSKVIYLLIVLRHDQYRQF